MRKGPLFLLFILLLSGGAVQAKAPDSLSVRLPIPVVEAAQTPFYVAKDRGFYADAGLSVTFNPGTPQAHPVKMVAAGRDDIGVLGGPDTLLVARSRGVDVRAVAVLHEASDFAGLVVPEASPIQTLEDLRGKRVGMFHGHISTDILRSWFAAEDVDVEEVDVGFDYRRLLTGDVAAPWGVRTTGGLDVPARGHPVRFLSPAESGIHTNGYTVFGRAATLKTRPAAVRKFLRAVARGVQATLDDSGGALESLLARDEGLDKELEAKRLGLYNAVTSTDPVGKITPKMFEETARRLEKLWVPAGPVDPEKAWTARFLPASEPAP